MDDDAVILVRFRYELGIGQATAAKIIGCSQSMVANIEKGQRRLGGWRHDRIAEARTVFASGGLPAVMALAPAVKPVLKYRTPVPVEDRDEMTGWRVVMDLTQSQAAKQLGRSVETIRAIEHGRLRISPEVRAWMEKDERKLTGRN